MSLRDASALAVGTLTRLPVRPPRTVDRRTAGGAMLLAPLVGASVGLGVGAAVQVLADRSGVGPLLAGTLAIAALAYLTRAIHLDGLADTADALGSGRPAPLALAIARRSDVGPFGVVAIVVVLLTQAVGVSDAVGAGRAAYVLAVALGAGRLTLALACRRSVPAARADGLGAAVAGSVSPAAFAAVTLGWTALATGTGVLLAAATGAGPGRWAVATIAATLTALAVGALVVRIAVRRLGGITGDVLGATTELAATAALVILVGVLP